MVRQLPTGLTAPKVENAELQRFCQQITERLTGITTELQRVSGRSGIPSGGQAGGGEPLPSGPGGSGLPVIPELLTPPKPVGVTAFCGIGIAVLSWENPFRFYSNHAHALIYRGVDDAFDQAVKIGQAGYFVFTDDTGMQSGTEYHYWVRFVSTTDVEGPLSDSVSCTSALDPAEVYAEIVAWLSTSPLAAALTSDILDPAFVYEEILRLTMAVQQLVAGAAQEADEAAKAANRAALSAKSSAEDALDRVSDILSTINVLQRGPAPNNFVGALRSDAEAKRDTQAADAAWLKAYNDDSNKYILLQYD